jgi:hypothetical protein
MNVAYSLLLVCYSFDYLFGSESAPSVGFHKCLRNEAEAMVWDCTIMMIMLMEGSSFEEVAMLQGTTIMRRAIHKEQQDESSSLTLLGIHSKILGTLLIGICAG